MKGFSDAEMGDATLPGISVEAAGVGGRPVRGMTARRLCINSDSRGGWLVTCLGWEGQSMTGDGGFALRKRKFKYACVEMKEYEGRRCWC